MASASMPHFRVGQWVRRGSDLEVDALDEQVGDIGSVPLSPLPSRAALSGATAARDIAPGEVITPASVTLASFVKTGDKVIVHATIKGLDIQATVVAAQGGRLGDLIRCVNPDTRHTMMVRIIGHGVGEVGLAF
jgi:flagella basal body P-ring formation protein FlgA